MDNRDVDMYMQLAEHENTQLPFSWFLPLLPQSLRNCRTRDCGSLSSQTQTSCCLSPLCSQRTSAPEEKETSTILEKWNNNQYDNSLRYWLLDTAFICDDFILQFTREIVSRNDYFYDLKIFITLMFSRTSVIFLARKLKLAHQEV